MDDIVFLFDVDNTLIDNDAIQADMRAHILDVYGEAVSRRYWKHFQDLWAEVGYADYIGALERTRAEDVHDPRILKLALWLIDYPFADRLYPQALEAVNHARRFGRAVVLSDGDAVFQPLKIERSGVWKAFGDDVLIFIHKEEELADVERLYPAKRYVLIDDKLRILSAMKSLWRDRVVTVFPQQGHFANDPKERAAHPAPDIRIRRIGDLIGLTEEDFVAPSAAQAVKA